MLTYFKLPGSGETEVYIISHRNVLINNFYHIPSKSRSESLSNNVASNDQFPAARM